MSAFDELAWRHHEYFFTTSDDVRIGFSDTGNHASGRGATVLFLHGWTQNREAWDDVAASLYQRNPGLRIVALDHRGHGQSDPAPAGTVNTAQLACDVAEFITAHIPSGQILIVGHSMGGMTMMNLGMVRPELVTQRISGAVFVNTTAGKPLRALRLLGPVLSIVFSMVLMGISRSWVIRRGYLLRPFIYTLFFGRRPRSHDVRRIWNQVCSGDPRSYREAAENFMNNNVYDGLQPYRGKPVSILAGKRDLLTAPSDSRDIAAILETQELHIYPGAGHMLPNERAEEVANEIVAVLDTLDSPRGLDEAAI